ATRRCASERPGRHAIDDASHGRGILVDRLAETAGIRIFDAIQLAGRIDRRAVLVGAELTRAIEGLERIAERIYDPVTAGTRRHGGMRRETFARRGRTLRRALLEFGETHVRRRGWHCLTQRNLSHRLATYRR